MRSIAQTAKDPFGLVVQKVTISLFSIIKTNVMFLEKRNISL